MKYLIQQLSGALGASIAAACCLGIPVVLSAVGAVGLSFLVKDAYLFPLFVAFVGFSLWMLYRAARAHGSLAPFWLGLAGALLGTAGLWLLVTGLYPMTWSVYGGIGLLVVGSVWDLVNGRMTVACETAGTKATAVQPVDTGRRAMTGAALSVAAAGIFYGMYKSVETFAPVAEEGTIACWGINSCKGQSACTTAFNACTAQNECRGRGFVNVSEKECYVHGGVPLQGSEADPVNG